MIRLCPMVLGLIVLAGPAPAQETAVRDTLEARGIPPELAGEIDALVLQASSRGIPTRPLIDKALEGAAKQVSAAQLLNAVRDLSGTLADGRDVALSVAGEAPSHELIAAAGSALRQRMSRADVRSVISAAPDEASAVTGLVVASTLAANGFASRDVATILAHAYQSEVAPGTLLELPSVATTLLAQGLRPVEVVARLLDGERL